MITIYNCEGLTTKRGWIMNELAELEREFWIWVAVFGSIPVMIAIVALLVWWDKKQEAKRTKTSFGGHPMHGIIFVGIILSVLAGVALFLIRLVEWVWEKLF
jgi:hypothetical protein